MAKPNYSFEKRQRELAKKKKKEEKLKEKADRKAGTPQEGETGADETQGSSTGQPGDQPAP